MVIGKVVKQIVIWQVPRFRLSCATPLSQKFCHVNYQLLGNDGAARLWDPSGKHRPMKEWVQIPFACARAWPELAAQALKYVEQ